MPESIPDAELNDLFNGLVHQTLTESQQQRLSERLECEPEARDHYVQFMQLHNSLRYWTSWPTDEQDAADAEDTAAYDTRANVLAQTARYLSKPTPFSMTVAALVLCVLIAGMALVASPIYHRLASQPANEVIDSFTIVAELTGLQDAKWPEHQIGTHLGAQLVAGQRMTLTEGLAQITFNDGATVLLQGPASVELQSAGALRLERGKLVAEVPPKAVGFAVAIPHARIVDLGTKFAVSIERGGQGEIHVFQGRVELQPSPKYRRQNSVVLVAGQGRRLGGDDPSTWNVVAANAKSFADFSDVPQPEIARFQNGALTPFSGEAYQGVEDLQIVSWAAGSNFGGRTNFDVGYLHRTPVHSLLRFDLSPLRGKVKSIRSVTLRLMLNHEVFYYPWGNSGTVNVHRLTDANANWYEGISQTGTDAKNPTIGDATWNFRRHAQDRWAGSFGASTPNIDFDATPVATRNYETGSLGTFELRLRGDLSFIQKWIDGETNAGFLLRETTGRPNNRVNFHSSESTYLAGRPQLIISYVPLAEDASPEPAPSAN